MEKTAIGKPRPLVLTAVVAVIIVSMLGAIAISGHSLIARSEKSEATAPKKRLAVELRIPALDGVCASCGAVEVVRVVEVKGNGPGLAASGAGRALIRSQFRSGEGNTAVTALGAADGALAGSEVETNVQKRVSYRVTVRMDDGSFRTVSQFAAPTVTVGDRVRIANGALVDRE